VFDPHVRPGLCSVTLRGSSPQEVVDARLAAGLSGVEWGADVHVPPARRAPLIASGNARSRPVSSRSPTGRTTASACQ